MDNDGNALVAGALYFNSVAGEMRLWTGAAWVAAYVSGAGFLSLTGGTMTGALAHPASTAATPSITFTGASSSGIYSPSADRVAISTNGLGRLFVAENGNVGIGLETPQKRLHVVGDSNDGIATGASALRVRSADGSAYFSSQYDGIDATTLYTPAGRLVFSVNSSEKVRIDNDGRVGINTASPAVTLDVSATDAVRVAAGTTGERPTGAAGMIRYNTTLSTFEGYKAGAWGAIGGGATGGGSDDVFYENGQTVTTNYTLSTNKNAVTAGPITVNSGVTVTIPSGSSWVVV